jgi:hypothetical protein
MRLSFTLFTILSSLFLIGCEKIEGNKDAQFRVYLTDHPYLAESVNIEILGIKVKYCGTVENANSTYTGKSEEWVWLDTKTGMYNLLDYKNGKSVLIAIGGVPGGHVKEIRFVIGKNNTIKIDGNSFPMQLPTGSEFGFKIPFVKQLAMPRDSVTIDFNAALSISQPTPGIFKLSPVLQIK